MTASKKIYYVTYLAIFIGLIIIMPSIGHFHDRACWKSWAGFILNNGLGNVYNSGTNYPPLFHYILFLYSEIQGDWFNVKSNIHHLKVISLIFDFIAGSVLVKIIFDTVKDTKKTLVYSLLLFLNPAYFYNTLVWGQVDGIMTCLVFLAFYFALREKVILTLIFVVLGLNFKLQAIIFVPLLCTILLPSIIKTISIKKLSFWIIVPVILQILIIMPFYLSGGLPKLWQVIIDSIGYYPVVSKNAFNFWRLLIEGDLNQISDMDLFLGIPYRIWGIVLFVITSTFALLPILGDVYSIVVYKTQLKISNRKLFIAAALLPLLFFFFNTQMHERYVHASIIFLAGSAIFSNSILVYILVSIAYLLNLEIVLQFLNLKTLESTFAQYIVAYLFLTSIILLFFKLYNKTKMSESFRALSF